MDAGVIDAHAASSILAFEASNERRTECDWPFVLALTFGSILVVAGVALFAAAHWSDISPTARFLLVLALVAVFHVEGASFSSKYPPLAATIHAVGTVTLGIEIFLTFRIFNINENWAIGMLLWVIGAVVALIILQDWIQVALLAVLIPAWLISQWSITTERMRGSGRPLAVGLILAAICYLSARIGDQASITRRIFVWIGGIVLLPCVFTAFSIASDDRASFQDRSLVPLPWFVFLVGWAVAVGGPLLFAWILRGRAVWINLLWAWWAYAVFLAATRTEVFRTWEGSFGGTFAAYALCVLGAVGLVAWGFNEKRKERVNLGIAAFASLVLCFYFDDFMGKLGRSSSLLMLGFICIAGGYFLEVMRRKLLARMAMSE